MKRILPIALVAILGIGAYFFFSQGEESTTADQNDSGQSQVAQTQSQTQSASDAGADNTATDAPDIADMMIGNPEAKVTVIEYASFTCPHCAAFHENTFKDLKEKYIDTGKINFVFREIYFDRFGLWASMIARCAGPDKYFGMTDLMFKSQSTWARAGEPAQIIAELRKVGRLAGLDDAGLDQCLEDEEMAKNLVTWYQDNAGRDEITSTPSFVINGTKYSNMNITDMSKIIDEALGE